MNKITVLGAGTWGMGIALLLNNNGHKVTVWSAVSEELDMLKNTKKHKNLPEVDIPDLLRFNFNPLHIFIDFLYLNPIVKTPLDFKF